MADTASPVRTISSGGAEGEPSMRLHRPSSARSQDVRHVLTRTFGDLFTRDAIPVDTIKNLITTRGGEDEYHERHVDCLQEVLTETENKLNEISMLEKHIMEAEVKALSADERHTHRATAAGQLEELGLPTGSNHFRSCLNFDLLKKFNLLTPDRYANYVPPTVPKPQPPAAPSYLKETANFVHASKGKKEKKERLRGSQCLKKLDSDIMTASFSLSKVNQLNSTLDNEDAESVDYIKEGSEAGGLYDSIATFQTHPAKSSIKNAKQNGKKTWTEQLAVEAREQDKAALAKLQTRTNYLKNPRHDVSQVQLLTVADKIQAKEVNIKQPPASAKPVSQVQVFLASPSVITFTNYQVGQVYEATLVLKNISASLRPVRVLPTSTNFFSIGLGQFPGEQGLVASGMSAQFKVRFMPDSLGEYSDEIHVQSQSAEPLIVKVIAKRPPPVLTLPPTINLGECLVGGMKISKFFIKNEGGSGKFCLVSKEKWPVTSFKTSVNPALLDALPFQIRPSIFELDHKDTTMIEVIYRPTTLGEDNHEVLMLCDNCHMKQFTITGKGQLAGAEFVAVDGGTSEKQAGELYDATSQKLIKFEDLNPFTYTQKSLIISNSTNVALPFEWMVVKPHITSGKDILEVGEDESSVDTTALSRTLDVESPFSIEPQNGVLEPSGIASFMLTFAPPEVKRYHSVLHMVLPGIPQQVETDTAAGKGSTLGSVQRDITALEIECKAECIPLQVLLKPYAIYVNGQSLLGSTVRRQFTLINNSVSSATFEWEGPSSGNILEVTPALGEVGPSMMADMELSITGCAVGKMHEIVWCHVKNLAEPIALHVDFEVKGPEVYIGEPDINFGLVRFGTAVTTTLTLHNESQMPASFEITEKLPANQPKEESEFSFTPKIGELKPLETRKIKVEFSPGSCKVVQTFFELAVGNGGVSRTVGVRADVQKPSVCLLSCNLNIPALFVDIKSIQTVTLINQSLLPTSFTWGEPFGDDVESCRLYIRKEGELGPRETLELQLRITSYYTGYVKDLILPCYISGMDEPLLLSITAKLEGVQIAYAIQDSPNIRNFDESKANTTSVDFGTVSVQGNAHKYLYIRNKSPMNTAYSLSVNHYAAKLPTPPANRTRRTDRKHEPKKALLQRTLNIADPNSKSKERAAIELQQQLLKTNKGVAIVPTPSQGYLGPYEELVVDLALYSDMWGTYEDDITLYIRDHGSFNIPVTAHVTGIPLQFHMAAVTKEPSLRFGTLASNAKSVTRTVRINNNGPVDTRVDWQMFNVMPGDQQLIDFVVSYGEPFPKRDADGNVARTPTPPAPPSSRAPTEYIPNTPDSTLAPSAKSPSASPSPTPRPDSQTSVVEKTPSSDPMIKVMLRKHGGHEACKPFTIEPKQMVIPARDKGFIKVTFNPESADPMGESCNSYILGYLNPTSDCLGLEGLVSRVSGYHMEEMKLNLAGCIEPALLKNEFMDDEGLRFRGVASDLLRDGVTTPKAYYCISNGTKLTNLTEALLSFKIDVSHPFLFTKSNPPAGEDNLISLKPNASAEIYIDFCVSPDQIALVAKHEEDVEGSLGQKPVVVVRKDSERQIHFNQSLKVLFTSGAIQELPLHASLVLPSLEVDSQEINFGTCLIGQRKQKTFMLKNRTRSHSMWSSKITFHSACPTDTFVMEPSYGHLDAHITHVTKSDVLIAVSFLAREERDYTAQYTISGVLGEDPLTITVMGTGSFDEKHEDMLNLVIDPLTSDSLNHV